MELSLEKLRVEDALHKLASFAQAVRMNMFSLYIVTFISHLFWFQVSDHISAELRIREKGEQVLKEQEKAWKETNEDLIKRIAF